MAEHTAIQIALSDELHILVVSSNKELVTCLQQHLYATWKSQRRTRCYDCKMHISASLAAIASEAKIPIKVFDYIVMIIEPKFMYCLKEIEADLVHLGDKYGRQKICLVAVGANYNAAVKPEELWKFAQIYQFNLLFGELKTCEKAEQLSNRILNLCEACTGTLNGIPLIGKI